MFFRKSICSHETLIILSKKEGIKRENRSNFITKSAFLFSNLSNLGIREEVILLEALEITQKSPESSPQ